MSEKKFYPKWAYRSRRQFMRDKRRDLRAALKAIDQLRNGCAYMPPVEFDSAPHLIDGLQATLKQLYAATMECR